MQNDKVPKRNCSFIMNNDISSGNGIHWVACIIIGKTVYIYDSFGRSSNYLLPIFSRNMKADGFKIVNTERDAEQFGDKSVICGHLCLSALKIYKNHGLKAFLKL